MKEQLLLELRGYLATNLVFELESDNLCLRESEVYNLGEEAPQQAFFRTSIPSKSVSDNVGEQSYQLQKDMAMPESTKEQSEDELSQVLERFRKEPNGNRSPKPQFSLLAHRSEKELEDYLKKAKSEETFSTRLLKYIDMIGLPDALIYKKAGIDRRHFSKIRCNKDYHPKKETVLTLCLALKLSLVQVEELLELAGFSLSCSDTKDLIVKFCIERKIYELLDVNEALEYFGEKSLGVNVTE